MGRYGTERGHSELNNFRPRSLIFAWQARGRRFESAMLHPEIKFKMALSGSVRGGRCEPSAAIGAAIALKSGREMRAGAVSGCFGEDGGMVTSGCHSLIGVPGA
jgi:hypothetical protein